MPYQIQWESNGIVWTYSGVLTGDDLLNSNFEIFGDERFDDLRYQIVDLTHTEEIAANEKHMRKIAHLDIAASRSNPRIKIAVVTNSEDGLNLSNTYDQYTKGKIPWKTKVFSTIEEAKAWADRP